MFRIRITAALLLLGILSFVPQAARAQAQPLLRTLHRFDGKRGAYPITTLTLGTDGNFYGVTVNGGIDNKGTVFSITPAGQHTTLFRFNGKNGAQPACVLAEGTDGAFYGTTQNGGAYGNGTAFRITSSGQFTTLHSFSDDINGRSPRGKLLLAPDGFFYGVASGGFYNEGTAFRMTASGQVTTLHAFGHTGGQAPDGEAPQAGLTVGPDGALYGTATGGGSYGNGVVYRLTTDGMFSLLHSFRGKDGEIPSADVTVGPDGALYGVTYYGGRPIIVGNTNYGTRGVAYKVTLSGKFTLLHGFSDDGHGTYPNAELTLGTDGLLYGTTSGGGTNNRGTVFVMTPAGQVTTLYKFHTDFDGSTPYGGVVFGLGRTLYGTTALSGNKYTGTIYSLTLPTAN